MSTELVRPNAATELAITEAQTSFTGQQVAMLQHIGVDSAGEADLNVFFHQCKRTGLDPFTRQIYMISRQVSKNVNGQWIKEAKQTIQTGIDGYRLIGRRAADRTGDTIKVHPPQWAHTDGSWRDVWINAWGLPVAARVTIERNGQPFTATALFDEYKQTKYGGGLTSMWEKRPAGQIAKCAEAFAWRMAFPHDLSGIYTDDEMGQADNQSRPEPAQPSPGLASLLEDAPADPPIHDMGELNIPQQVIDTAATIADPATMADFAEHLKSQGAPAHVTGWVLSQRKEP